MKKILGAVGILAVVGLAAGIGYYKFLAPRIENAPAPAHHLVVLGDCSARNAVPYLRELLGNAYLVSRDAEFAAARSFCGTLDWVAFENPDTIYVNVGMYDLLHPKAGLSSPQKFSELLEKDFLQLRERAPRARIIWGTIPPVDAGVQRAAWHIQHEMICERDLEAFNAVIREFCLKQGLEIVDIYAVIADSPTNTLLCGMDGVHLSDRGCQASAAAIARQITETQR